MAIPQDFPDLIRGDYFARAFRIRRRLWDPQALGHQGGAWVPGPYRNLTGWTGLFHVRQTFDGTLTCAGEVIILDQDDIEGGVMFALDASDTQVLLGKYVYDVQLTNELGQPKTYIRGSMTWEGDVSHV